MKSLFDIIDLKRHFRELWLIFTSNYLIILFILTSMVLWRQEIRCQHIVPIWVLSAMCTHATAIRRESASLITTRQLWKEAS